MLGLVLQVALSCFRLLLAIAMPCDGSSSHNTSGLFLFLTGVGFSLTAARLDKKKVGNNSSSSL